MSTIEIFTDGACSSNPGPGGWGALIRIGGAEKNLYGGEESTTNNRMELMAVIKALASLADSSLVAVTTDSQYVKKGITEWIVNWKRNGWKTSKRKPVKNSDLWRQLDGEVERHTVSWHWVKGHSGHRENEIADSLANRGMPC